MYLAGTFKTFYIEQLAVLDKTGKMIGERRREDDIRWYKMRGWVGRGLLILPEEVEVY